MSNRFAAGVAATAFCILASWCSRAVAADGNAQPAVVLDAVSPWRIHETLKPPVARMKDGLKPLLCKAPWVDRQTAEPPADWTKPDFDDHRWMRAPARLTSATPVLSRLCLRGKFTVTDQARVRGLRLSVGYQGGVVVCVNGQEVRRGHIAPGETDLAEDYPDEAFLNKDGTLLTFQAARYKAPDGPWAKLSRRELADVEIPAKMLRPGVNVVAVEIVRSAYPAIVAEKRDPKSVWNLPWDTCRVNSLRLTAGGTEGLVPNAARPAGFQVWNNDLLACDYDLDWGDPSEKLHPIEIVAARNGVFSGKAVVGCTSALAGLKASPSELKGPGGAIPASQVQVRYGLPWGSEDLSGPYDAYPFPAEASLLGCLAAAAPESIPIRDKKTAGRPRPPGQSAPVPGAVVPVWVTVRVPKDAKAGAYEGTVTVQASGQKPVAIPLQVRVADWTLPNPQDYRTSVEIIQSPDTLAMEYDAPLWSQKHWDLIAESFRILADSGNRNVYVPLIAETNFGHEQSMVKWTKKAENQYDYDFTVLDKYLDAAEKNLGKPKLVVFLAWDVYMLEKGKGGTGANSQEQAELLKGLEAAGALQGKGPVVTLRGAAEGKTENVVLPRYTDSASKALWKPLWDQLRQRMAKRGLEGAMALGMLTDAWPTKEEVAFLAEMAPGVPWVAHAHFGAPADVYGLAKTAYQVRVWSINPPGDKSLQGWKQPALFNRYFRQGEFDHYPSSMWRHMFEYAITGDQRGVGRLGAEFWPVIKDKAGQRKGRIYARYPQSNWRNLDVYTSLLAPGPAAPAATHHYVHMVEGIQECEARTLLERTLADESLKGRLGPDLARRCQDLLEERLRSLQTCFSTLINYLDGSPCGLVSTGSPSVAGRFWCIGSGWQDRMGRLYDLAAEVEKRLGAK